MELQDDGIQRQGLFMRFVTLAFVDRRNEKMYSQCKKLMVLIGFLPKFCENS